MNIAETSAKLTAVAVITSALILGSCIVAGALILRQSFLVALPSDNTQPSVAKRDDGKASGPQLPDARVFDLSALSGDLIEGYRYPGDNHAITLAAYTDVGCGYCKKFIKTVQKMREEGQLDANLVLRHYPLNLDGLSYQVANATECAGAIAGPAAYYGLFDGVFAGTLKTLEQVREHAHTVLDSGNDQVQKFDKCVDELQFGDKVAESRAVAEKFGINGTPSSILYNKATGKALFLVGALSAEQVKQFIAKIQ